MEIANNFLLNRRVRYFSAAVCLVFMVLLVPYGPRMDELLDYPVYYDAGEKTLEHMTVYDVPGHFKFKYAPFVALAFGSTVSQLPYEQSALVFHWFLLIGWAAFVYLMSQILAERFLGRKLSPWELVALLAADFALFYNPWRQEMTLGQVNLLVLGLSLFFFAAYRPKPALGRAIALSIALSLAVQIKLFCALIFPFLLFRREYRLIVLTGLSTVAMNLGIFSLYHGWDFALSENIEWLMSLTSSSAELLYSRYNAGIIGVVGRTTTAFRIDTWIWLGLTGYFLWLQWRIRDRDPLMSFALVYGYLLLINPLVWSYWLMFLAPAVTILIMEALKRSTAEQREMLKRGWFPLLLLFVFSWVHKGWISRRIFITATIIAILAWFFREMGYERARNA